MVEKSSADQKPGIALRNNVQHMRRRVHRVQAVLRALRLSQRWRSRSLEKNLRLLKRCALTMLSAELADSTRKAYWQCYLYRKRARLLNPAATANRRPITKRSWNYNRAALQFGFASELLAWVDTPEYLQVACFGPSYDALAECRRWMRRLEVILKWAAPGVRVDSQLDSTKSTIRSSVALRVVAPVTIQRPATFARGTSKRQGLSDLEPNWRQTFWQHVSLKTRYRTHMAALILTGARPCEFESSIRVRLESSATGDRLVFLIRGRKKTETTGLSWRRVIVDVQGALKDPNRSAAVDHLIGQLRNQPRQRIDVKCKAKALNAAVSAVGAQAFPDEPYLVAPYSFRHQLASDLKASGIDKVGCARILSHASTRTADHYGYARRGGRGTVPLQTLPVRSGGAKGQVRIKHAPPPNWPAVRSAASSKLRKHRKRP